MELNDRQVVVYDRETGEKVNEIVFGGNSLLLMYRGIYPTRPVEFIISRSLFGRLYARLQTTRFSRRKIGRIVSHYDIDASEFVKPIDQFETFNAFFTRELKPEARPIEGSENIAVTPCDAKYLVFDDLSAGMPACIKEEEYYLDTLLDDKVLASRYRDGSMAVIRLALTDYHRFHFPLDCVPGTSRLIGGHLYPVNPYALYDNLRQYSRDKRMITELDSDLFGKVLMVEVGATAVGSIVQTFTPGQRYRKGDEKGYFSLGGSSIVILFEKGKIRFDDDLRQMTAQDIEVRSRYGRSLGVAEVPG